MIFHCIHVLCLVYIVTILEIGIASLYQDTIEQLLNPVFCINLQRNGTKYLNKSKIVVAVHHSNIIYVSSIAVNTECNIPSKIYVCV